MKRVLRSALTVIFVAGLVTALWPLGQGAYGLWSQRALQAAWHESVREYEKNDRPQTTKPQVAPAHKATLVSGSQRASKSSRSHGASKNGKSKAKIAQGISARRTSARSISRKGRSTRRPRFTKWPPTRLIIPDIDLDVIVVDGHDEAALRRGPGHHSTSALPGEWGNCVIAGHRNVYGSWFYRLGELGSNSIIQLCTPGQTFTYKVATTFITDSNDTFVLQDPVNKQARPRLTLYTCTLPKTSNRVVVVANLVEDSAVVKGSPLRSSRSSTSS